MGNAAAAFCCVVWFVSQCKLILMLSVSSSSSSSSSSSPGGFRPPLHSAIQLGHHRGCAEALLDSGCHLTPPDHQPGHDPAPASCPGPSWPAGPWPAAADCQAWPSHTDVQQDPGDHPAHPGHSSTAVYYEGHNDFYDHMLLTKTPEGKGLNITTKHPGQTRYNNRVSC